jgi:hypothetical protein
VHDGGTPSQLTRSSLRLLSFACSRIKSCLAFFFLSFFLLLEHIIHSVYTYTYSLTTPTATMSGLGEQPDYQRQVDASGPARSSSQNRGQVSFNDDF